MSYLICPGANFYACPSYAGLTWGGVAPPPPSFTGFPHGGQYLIASTTRMLIRFGWAWGMN